MPCRFLMKTLRARQASRLIHAFRQNPLWIRSGCAAVFVSPAKPGLGNLGDRRSTNRAHGSSGKSSIRTKAGLAAARARGRQGAFQTCCYGQPCIPKSLLALVCTPSLTVLSPSIEQLFWAASRGQELIEAALQELRPLELILIEPRTQEANDFVCYLERDHYLGFGGASGHNLRYLVRDCYGRDLACVLFGGAAWKVQVSHCT
jgi:Domain of unknown function (DUF4338)